MRRIFLFFCFFFLSVHYGHADTHTADSCSLADVTTAYNASSDGDILAVPAGNCTWSSALTIGKALSTLGAGSGVGGTKLTASGAMSSGFFNITGFTSSNLMRISGFYFEMTNWTPATAINVSSITDDNVRIDHNTFNQGSHAILFYNPLGVIDHNTFYNSDLTIEYSSGSRANADASWVSMAVGTANATFIEDNHFIDDANYTGTYFDERVGTFNGGKLVVRHNHFDSTQSAYEGQAIGIMTHGSAAGGCSNGYWQITGLGGDCRRGQSVVEIYENLIEGKRIDYPVVVRGSANLIYNNTTISASAGASRIAMSEEEYTVGSNWSPLRTAWPAEDQVHNTFIWGNTFDGEALTSENLLVEPSETYIELNRDYFLHAPCGASDTTDGYGNTCTHGKETFTGANGASSSYPTDGSTYPTLGTMQFVGTGDNAYYGYNPYTYPHPLALAQYTLAITKNGTGSGTVAGDVGYIDCGAVCSHDYDVDTVVTLTATPTGSDVFAGWSGTGGCLGTGTCVATMDAAYTPIATFNLSSSIPHVTIGSGPGMTISNSGPGIKIQ